MLSAQKRTKSPVLSEHQRLARRTIPLVANPIHDRRLRRQKALVRLTLKSLNLSPVIVNVTVTLE